MDFEKKFAFQEARGLISYERLRRLSLFPITNNFTFLFIIDLIYIFFCDFVLIFEEGTIYVEVEVDCNPFHLSI